MIRPWLPLSLILGLVFIDRILKCSYGEEDLGNLGSHLCFFAYDVLQLASSSHNPLCAVRRSANNCEVVGMRVRSSKCELMVFNGKRQNTHSKLELSLSFIHMCSCICEFCKKG